MPTQDKTFQPRVLGILDRRLAGAISDQGTVQELRDLFQEERDIESNLDQIIKSVSKRKMEPFRMPDLRMADSTLAPEIDRALWRFWIDLGLGLSPYAEISLGCIKAMEFDFRRPEQPFSDI